MRRGLLAALLLFAMVGIVQADYLVIVADLEEAGGVTGEDRPPGHLVELDVARDVPAAAAALEAAQRRGAEAP